MSEWVARNFCNAHKMCLPLNVYPAFGISPLPPTCCSRDSRCCASSQRRKIDMTARMIPRVNHQPKHMRVKEGRESEIKDRLDRKSPRCHRAEDTRTSGGLFSLHESALSQWRENAAEGRGGGRKRSKRARVTYRKYFSPRTGAIRTITCAREHTRSKVSRGREINSTDLAHRTR